MERVAELIARSPDTTANLACSATRTCCSHRANRIHHVPGVGPQLGGDGDPVGPPDACETLAWEFLRIAM